MISSSASPLMRKLFFPTTSRSFGTFYGHDNLNIIHSFKVAKPWRSSNMFHSKEISKCGHRLPFFISYATNASGSDDFPKFVVHESGVEVRVSSAYKWIWPERIICFRQIGNVTVTGDYCVKDGQKVKVHCKLYDNYSHEVRDTSKHIIIGPGKNKICEGLYEGIVGMRLQETRRIVLPPSPDSTGKNATKSFLGWRLNKKPEEHRIYDVYLLDIIP